MYGLHLVPFDSIMLLDLMLNTHTHTHIHLLDSAHTHPNKSLTCYVLFRMVIAESNAWPVFSSGFCNKIRFIGPLYIYSPMKSHTHEINQINWKYLDWVFSLKLLNSTMPDFHRVVCMWFNHNINYYYICITETNYCKLKATTTTTATTTAI